VAERQWRRLDVSLRNVESIPTPISYIIEENIIFFRIALSHKGTKLSIIIIIIIIIISSLIKQRS